MASIASTLIFSPPPSFSILSFLLSGLISFCCSWISHISTLPLQPPVTIAVLSGFKHNDTIVPQSLMLLSKWSQYLFL